MTIMPEKRSLELNGIRGHIDGEGHIGISERLRHHISWSWSLISLNKMTFRNGRNNEFVVILDDLDALGVGNQAEFTCARG
jgi:hypothetical protein